MLKEQIKQFIHSLGFDLVKYYPDPEMARATAINSQQKAYFLKRLTYQNIDSMLHRTQPMLIQKQLS